VRGFYHFKINGNWTPPLERLPRWFEVNSIPDLNTFTPLPSAVSVPTSKTYTKPTSNSIPVSWVLSSTTYISSGALSGYFDVLSNNLEYIRQNLLRVEICSQNNVDTGELDFVWLATSQDPEIKTVSVLISSGSYLTVNKVQNDLDLFYPSTWSWKNDKGTILISGLDLQEHSLTNVSGASGWLFLTSPTLWTPGLDSVFIRPNGLAINIHQSEKRSDGLSYFYKEGQSYVVRSRNVSGTIDLPEVSVQINDFTTTAKRVPLWTGADEIGLYIGLSRRDNETIKQFKNVLLNSWSFLHNHSKNSVVAYISGALRASETFLVTSGLTSAYYFNNGKNLLFQTIDKYKSTRDVLRATGPTSSRFLSKIPSWLLYCGDLDGKKTTLTEYRQTPDNGYIEFEVNPTIKGTRHRLTVDFLQQTYSFTSSSLLLNTSFPSVKNYKCLVVKDVYLDTPDSFTKRNAITQSGMFLWKSTLPDEEEEILLSGSAVFV
jgi:hypothetical protein